MDQVDSMSLFVVNQEFMSSACIEHLDFLDLSADVQGTFKTFQEKDKGKHYRSLTEIPKLVKTEMEEAWSETSVRVLFLFTFFVVVVILVVKTGAVNCRKIVCCASHAV